MTTVNLQNDTPIISVPSTDKLKEDPVIETATIKKVSKKISE